MYTPKQRYIYNIKRHLFSFCLTTIGCTLLLIYKDVNFILDTFHFLIMKLFSVGLGISVALLCWKFAFPKITLQDKIHENPIAVSIFAGLLFISIALMF